MGNDMRVAWAGVVAVVFALTACRADAEPQPTPTTRGTSGPVAGTEVVEFDAQGFYGPPFAAVIDSAAAARAFPGWFATRAQKSSAVPLVVAEPERLTGFDTHVYVATVTSTSCRLPTSAELRRDGAELTPVFVGGIDRPECVRAYTPFAVFEVSRAAMAGVTTVAGAPIDRDGPAELVGQVELSPTAPGFAPREVTDPDLRAALVSEIADAAGVRAVLDGTSRLTTEYAPATVRRYAFPVRSCPDDVVAMRIGVDGLRAEASTPADAPRTCEAPTAHLAVFDVRGIYVPDGARPMG